MSCISFRAAASRSYIRPKFGLPQQHSARLFHARSRTGFTTPMFLNANVPAAVFKPTNGTLATFRESTTGFSVPSRYYYTRSNNAMVPVASSMVSLSHQTPVFGVRHSCAPIMACHQSKLPRHTNATEKEALSLSTPSSILVAVKCVPPSRKQEFEDWEKELTHLAGNFPGHVWTEVHLCHDELGDYGSTKYKEGEKPLVYVVTSIFRSQKLRNKFRQSLEYQELFGRAEDDFKVRYRMETDMNVKRITDMTLGGFVAPSNPATLSSWRTYAVVLSCIFPMTLLGHNLLSPAFQVFFQGAVPYSVVTYCSVIISVALNVWVLMPAMQGLARRTGFFEKDRSVLSLFPHLVAMWLFHLLLILLVAYFQDRPVLDHHFVEWKKMLRKFFPNAARSLQNTE